jgi:ribosome-binding ATPase YchF (GTP1/OBG family)
MDVTSRRGEVALTHLSEVEVPDERLAFIGSVYPDKKLVQERLTLIDMPGRAIEGEARILAHLREMDGLMATLAHFGEFPEPREAFKELMGDYILADLQVTSHRIERLEKSVRHATATQEAEKRELALLQRVRESLEKDLALREMPLTPVEKKALAGFALITLKPIFLVLNISESDLGAPQEEIVAGLASVYISAQLEKELAQLESEERVQFAKSLGLETFQAPEVIKAARRSLGLITFFTVGDEEIRAWGLEEGEAAVAAAGKVHTDMARGFIRAEVTSFEDFKAAGSLKDAKSAGKTHTVAKDHIVSDGDILYFHFHA